MLTKREKRKAVKDKVVKYFLDNFSHLDFSLSPSHMSFQRFFIDKTEKSKTSHE